MKSLDELFAGVKTAAIAGHIRPDGDCVGSCLATYNYITTYYPQIEVSLYLQPIPNIFKFMKNADKIISDCTEIKSLICLSHRTAGIWADLETRQNILSMQKKQRVSIIISVTRVLRMKTIFFRRRVLRRNWYLN